MPDKCSELPVMASWNINWIAIYFQLLKCNAVLCSQLSIYCILTHLWLFSNTEINTRQLVSYHFSKTSNILVNG